MNEEQTTQMESNIEDIPQEVKDFIFGEGYKTVKEEILKNIDKSDERLELSNMLMFFLLGAKTLQELDYYIQALSIATEKKDSIRKLIKEKIIEEIFLIIEVAEEFDENSEASVSKKVPFSSLTALADRLKNSSTITPTTRSYTLERGSTPTQSAPANLPIAEPGIPTPAAYAAPMDTISEPSPAAPTEEPVTPITKSFDPYHESIDK